MKQLEVLEILGHLPYVISMKKITLVQIFILFGVVFFFSTQKVSKCQKL